MRAIILSFAGVCVAGLLAAGAADAPAARALEPKSAATQPGATTQPGAATQPASGQIRGSVKITGGLALQHPDLSRVVVYLASHPNLDASRGPTTRAVVSQYQKTFRPNFAIVARGTEVEFPNWDRFDHNVFSRSAAAPAFDLDRYPYGKSKTRKFDKLGVVQVFCNIHPQMRTVIYVTPNGYFARAGADGRFQIDGVPQGTFQVVAWQERCEELRQAVTVTGQDTADINFTLKESRDRVLGANDNRRESYGVERGLGVKREQLNLPVVPDAHAAPADSRP